MSVNDLDEETKKIYDTLYSKYPEAISFLCKQRPDERLLLIDSEISKILQSEAKNRGLILLKNNGIVGEGRIQFKTVNMTNNLLHKSSVKDNPFIYEISVDGTVTKSKMQSYAWAYNPNLYDGNVKKLLEACAKYETENARKPIKSKCLKFTFTINVDAIYNKLLTDSTTLIEGVKGFLDEIRYTESRLENLIKEENS